MEGSELIRLADDLHKLYEKFEVAHGAKLSTVATFAAGFVSAWSGSNIGYHSCVYYVDFGPPPPGAHFSSEWGFEEYVSQGTRGDWREYRYEDVINSIHDRTGRSEIEAARSAARSITEDVERIRGEVVSGLTIALRDHDDPHLRKLCEKAEKVRVRSTDEFARALLPHGRLMTRDSLASGQGIRAAPHQYVMADVMAIRSPSVCAKDLADIARQAGSHLTRLARTRRKESLVGTNVFIGHGRSPAWRILKDFVKDRLCLPYDEFNRVPVAGVANIARLSEMLDASAIAFLILTAEDEQIDGKLHARLNVVHEVGLFQGRLGFTKAIVLLEDTCEEFSNIQGLGQIRFPRNNIAAAFEDVRLVLEREGLIEN